MDGEKFQRLKVLFQEACDLAASERRSFVDGACDGDAELRVELERLLTHASFATTGGLQPAAVTPLAETLEVAAAPESLGSYDIVGELGRGGMGVVYEAIDRRLDRSVALKILPTTIIQNESAREGFLREAKLLASLNHPNIATVFSLEEADGAHFYTLERIRGESLAARLERGPIAPSEALSLARQMSLALEAAHREGVIHLDFKPGNVMLTDSGQIKVLDFGIARSLGADVSSDPASGGAAPPAAIAGTPGYMAPEQIQGAVIDARTDLWAFGCVLYEMVAGQRCFGAATVADVVHATLHGNVPWETLPAAMNHGLRHVIERCLQRELSDRLESSAELRRLLDREVGAHLAEEVGPRPRIPAAAHRSSSTSPGTEPPTRGALPRNTTVFIGRAALVDDVISHCQQSRLVTLTGLGGSGKTRLAIEVARRLEGNAHTDRAGLAARWVDLAALTDASTVVPHCSTSILPGSTIGGDLTALVDELRDHELLLVIDNCEHLIEPVAELVQGLLEGCARIRVLTTSREALEVPGEVLIGVPPLAVPRPGVDSVDEILSSESAQLLVERAERRGFQLTDENAVAVGSICRRLDGIPLALELAASRLQMLTPAELDKRLEYRFRILTRGRSTAPVRQRTLQATLDWSYELLGEEEQLLFQRLSIFEGSWTLHAAEEICAAESGRVAIDSWEVLDLLTSLINKSLVSVDAGSEASGARYHFLETVRVYAAAKWDEGGDDRATVQCQFVDHYAHFAGEAGRHLEGPQQARWFRRLDRESENIFRVLELCASSVQDFANGAEIAANVHAYWEMRCLSARALPLLKGVIEGAPEGTLSPQAKTKGLNGIGMLLIELEEYDEARRYYDLCFRYCKDHGYEANAAVVSMNHAILTKRLGDYDEARRLYEESLEITRAIGEEAKLVLLLLNLGILENEQGNWQRGEDRLNEALEIATRRGDPHTIAACYGSLGTLRSGQGVYAEARDLHQQAEQIFREIGDPIGIARSLGNQSIVVKALGDLPEAKRLLNESLARRREIGAAHGTAIALVNLAPVERQLGNLDRARLLLVECFDLLSPRDHQRTMMFALDAAAECAFESGDLHVAVECLASAAALRDNLGVAPSVNDEADVNALRANLCAQLDDDTFTLHWQHGAAKSPRDAAHDASIYLSKKAT